MGQRKARFAVAACMVSISLMLGACKSGVPADSAPKAAETGQEELKLVFWHYYNDAQKQYLDRLIKEYNETEGAGKHVVVEASSQGSIGDLTNKIDLALNGSTNDVEMANMSLAYRDMIVGIVNKHGERLVDAGDYLSEEDLAWYNQAYLDEGYIGGKPYILPLVKSTELLLMNQTRLDRFLDANPRYSADGMSDWDSLEQMAQGYFEWTDSATPDVDGDGSPFIGLDNLANYFIAMNHAMGSDIYHYDQDGSLVVDLNEEYIRRLFLNYYIPFTKGYYGASGKYRSDDIKQSVLAGYVGSSSSVLYFPDEVADRDGNMVPVEIGVYKYPVLSGSRETAIQQGAGVVVFNRSQEENQASMDFIRWLTVDKGFELASSMSYMPVDHEPMTQDQEKLIESPKVLKGIEVGLEQSSTYQMVYGFDFEDSYDVRTDLNDCFSTFLKEGRAEFVVYLDQGMTMEEAAQAMAYDSKAEAFYEQVKEIFGQ